MKQKILYINPGFGLSGAPKILSLLIAGLDKKKFDPLVALPNKPSTNYFLLQEKFPQQIFCTYFKPKK